MRATAIARILALIAIVLASGGALGQPPVPQLAPPDRDDPIRMMREAEKYQNVCREFRATGAAALDPSLRKQFFQRAISGFCAYGEFILTGGTFKAAQNAAGTCATREILDNDQLSFIRNLGHVRSQPFFQIRLECVTVSGSTLMIFDVSGANVMLQGVVADAVVLRGVNASLGLSVQSSHLRQGLGLLQVSSGGPLQINNSELGAHPNWDASFVTAQVSVESVALRNATLHGAFQANYLVVKSNLAITAKTRIGGSLDLQGASIGNALAMDAAILGNVVRLNYLSADRIRISNKTRFEGDVFFDHSVINKELLIESGTEFIKQTVLTHARIHHMHIKNATFTEAMFLRHAIIETELRIEQQATFKRSLYAENLRANAVAIADSTVENNLSVDYGKIGSLEIENSRVAPPDCKGPNEGCNVSLFNADIGYVRTRNAKIRMIRAGNARMRILLISGPDSVVENLECGDCHIEQFALLAGQFTKGVGFIGAEIKGTLAFREGASHVVWGDDAWLNLSEARVDIIVADGCDLVLAKSGCKDRPTIADTFVPTVLTGARYRTILPGRGNVIERPMVTTKSLLDVQDTRVLKKFITSANESYNPQPYHQLATALSGAGKNREAIDVRIARIDAMLADPNARPNILMRFIWGLYYYVSHYGFRNLYAFLWFLGLLAVGSVVKLMSRPEAVKHILKKRQYGMLFGLWLNNCWFALDRAVPPLRLDPDAEDRYLQADNRLPRPIRHYFYFHRVAGMVLISFFAAGLAGLGH